MRCWALLDVQERKHVMPRERHRVATSIDQSYNWHPKKSILIVIWHRRARAFLTQNCVARLQGKSHQEHHHHLAATGQYYWSKCLSLRRHPATGLLQMYPETRAMDDPYDIHSRGFSDHSAVIAEVALSRKSIGTLIIPEWHVLRTLATAAGVVEL